jgi:hypothetical protein
MTPPTAGGKCKGQRWSVVGGVNNTDGQWWAVIITPLTVGESVNNTADQWWAVTMTPLTSGGQ